MMKEANTMKERPICNFCGKEVGHGYNVVENNLIQCHDCYRKVKENTDYVNCVVPEELL